MTKYSQRLRQAKHARRPASKKSDPSLLAGPHFHVAPAKASLPPVADLPPVTELPPVTGLLAAESSSVLQADFEAMLNAAKEAQQRGEIIEALRLYDHALQLKPNHEETLHGLGDLCLQQGSNEAAAKLFQKAITARPQAALFHIKLAIAHSRMGKPELACHAADRAAELRPRDVSTLLQTGRMHLDAHHRSVAIGYFDRVLAIDSKNIAAIAAKAHLCEQDSKLNQAKNIVDQHLEQDPGCVPLATTAARLERRAGNYAEAIQVIERATAANPAVEASPTVQFELGHIHDAAGDYDKAFLAASTANLLKPASDRSGFESFHDVPQQLALLRSGATSEWVQSWEPTPPFPDSQSPIFVFGFPRSGNTLLDQILKCHSYLQPFMEKPVMRQVTSSIGSEYGSYMETIAKIPPEKIEDFRNEYFRIASRFIERDPARRLVDTHPVNTHLVAMMHRLFPTTKYVFVVRHPYDACISCFLQDFRNPMLRDNTCSLDAIADWYIATAELWKQHCKVLPIQPHVVRYENLVESFDDEVQSLCQYFDIPWEESMRDFNVKAKQGGVATASYHQVTQKLYRRATYRWKNYAHHLAPVLPRLRPYAEELGYDVD